MSDNTNNLNNRNNTTFILYIVVCSIFLIALIIIYLLFSSSIKKSMDYSLGKFETNSQIQLSNYYEFLKATVTNESFENKEFIKNTLEEAFKPNIDLLRETLKDSKDFSINTVTFWLAFLSLIIIIFTILGIYANNKIMESNQKQSELIIKENELKSKESIENLKSDFNNMKDNMLQEINNIKNNLLEENKEYIEKFKLDFDNIKNSVLKEMDTIKTEAINAKDNVKESEKEIGNIKSDLLKEKDTLIENAKKELNEQKDKITEFIETIKNNAINEVTNIKEEINNNKKEAKDLKSEIERIKEEVEKMLKEMKEERKAQKTEGQTILTEMEKQQKINDLLNKAYIEVIKKNKFEAIKLYTKVLDIDYKNITALNNRGNVYSEKYEETKEEEYFNKGLEDYNKALDIYNNDINILCCISFLYLSNYEITNNNEESLKQAEKYLNEGLYIEPNNVLLLNNKGILLYLQYKENNNVNYLKESLEYLNKSIEKNKFKLDIRETYYYLHLVYDEYAKLDENISGYSKEECKNKSDMYLQQSKDLGFKHFMEK